MVGFRAALPLLRPLPLVAAAAWLLLPASDVPPDAERARGAADPTGDLSRLLRARGLLTQEVRWVDRPGGISALWDQPRAFATAHSEAGANDVFLTEVDASPEGRAIDLARAYNITETSMASERGLAVEGERAAWLIGSQSRVYRVELADLAGQAPPDSVEWTTLARLQHALTNWQRTGTLRGIARRSFKLEPAAESVELDLDGQGVKVLADGHRIFIPWDPDAPVRGRRYIVEQDRELARPGNVVTWAVDRAREMSWLGSERLQWVKAVAYAALDVVERAWGHVRTDDSAQRISEEMGLGFAEAPKAFAQVEAGWPPPPMRPVFSEPLEGEGVWRNLASDPFVLTNPGAPPAVATTFIRTDEERIYSRIFVAIWDPRQIDLHMMPGTEEPQSATGETGSGHLPRDPEVLTRLVGAFNGGFQSTHGDYGMMVDGEVLVPPRPYAATVAKLEDGTTAFGTWPHDLTIDPQFVAFRQNLTPLLSGGELNPYDRLWWGGVPQGWEDETRTVRSGLCLTKEGFLAYFYGSKVDHEHLGVAMQSARCDYGMHLDMNQGHTGLEFYRVAPESELPPLDIGGLDGIWQAEGAVQGLEGYRFRGRRLIKNMQLMNFPRYIRRSQRDFFYLTLRHLLPRPPLEFDGAEGHEGTWKVDGLPQHGWPSAIATTEVRPDPARPETKLRVLAIDPKMIAIGNMTSAGKLVVLGQTATDADTTLFYLRRAFAIGRDPPAAQHRPLVSGHETPSPNTRAAWGIDRTGMGVFVEVATGARPGKDGALLQKMLAALGCRDALFLDDPSGVAIGGTHDLGGHPAVVSPSSVVLVRRTEPDATRIFKQTPVLPRKEWAPLQKQRRFFARESEAEDPPPPL